MVTPLRLKTISPGNLPNGKLGNKTNIPPNIINIPPKTSSILPN